MQLSKLIGLEILKLHEENDTLIANIAEYEKVLSDSKELYKVIKGRLREFKKIFNSPRRTSLMDTVAKAYVEKVVIEDLYVCFDRLPIPRQLMRLHLDGQARKQRKISVLY